MFHHCQEELLQYKTNVFGYAVQAKLCVSCERERSGDISTQEPGVRTDDRGLDINTVYYGKKRRGDEVWGIKKDSSQ